VKCRFHFAELRAQVLRQTSLVERASQVGHIRRRHDVGDVVDSRLGTGEACGDALGRQADRFHQLDRAAAEIAKGGVVNELRRLTAREDVFKRHALDEEERPGAELVDQAIHGRLDVLYEVGVMVRLAELRSKQVLRHGLSFGSCSRSHPRCIPCSQERTLAASASVPQAEPNGTRVGVIGGAR
jgi:hypothetical protein